MKECRVFSPGEVIFFGEHSVVYGRSALACAIAHGVRVWGRNREDEKRVEIHSHLGRLSMSVQENFSLQVRGDELLRPLAAIFESIFRKYGRSIGLDIQITSEIPEQSGLASSAAVSSALIRLLLAFLGEQTERAELIGLVYESEIHIQKRGSILGSCCTVQGGFVQVAQGRWEALPAPVSLPKILIIDSGERCATSRTTQSVRERHLSDRPGTEKIFDEMDRLAREGKSALERSDWKKMGSLMSENQAHLAMLGVSTAKIDRLLAGIRDFVYGAKITGAGGGGCVLCLPKEGFQEKLGKKARELGCEILPSALSLRGVSLEGSAQPCKR